MSTRDRRVTLALKWHYLDNLDVSDIQERFEAEGIGSYAASTIRGYLNEEPKEAVIEQIEKENADVRLQVAEREERMYQRARDAETQATEDEPIKRVVPQTQQVPLDADGPVKAPGWERVDPEDEDYLEWAEPRDVIIRFTDERRQVHPGESMPVKAIDGSPKYTSEFCGVRRDQPDLKGQAMARQEQSSHLEAKADVLGVYQTDINMQVDGDVDHSVELPEETAAAIREATLQEDTNE
ncbi:hypothetical protein [Halorubellus sp. JP-L1]|uniref:hypothetical protein n=1 Tax=Halorubellus sp. JP-L1 TaxID=2715753 RepID=UPI0019651AA3|nr:hypothetical protein [Halorubellus sp. JP-L1]